MSPTLPKRRLGKNGAEVTALGYGAMGLSEFYTTGKTSREEQFAILDHCADAGCTFWDTSDRYGDNEDIIGEWFKKTGRRNDIFLATKFGNFVNDKGEPKTRGDPEYVHQACAKSMRRLGVDVIDLYYVHRIDRTVPIEKTMEALTELVKAGKIKHLGLSECSAETLRRAHAVHPIAAIQMEYSPFALDIEMEETPLLKTARELGVTIVAYSPLGRGMLTGKYRSPDDFDKDDVRTWFPRFSKENFGKNLVLIDKLAEMAKAKEATPGQLTLAWILAQGDDFIPIPGTKRIKYLDENLGALKIKLTPEEVKEIREWADSAQIAGSRYPEAFSSSLFGDTPPL